MRIDDMTIEDVLEDVSNPQFNIEVEVRERQNPLERKRRGRVYAREWNDFHKTPRIFIFPEGESILDNFFIGRHNRPYKMYREKILPTVFEEIGWTPDTKVRWSQYAGCSCPCSPGFAVTQPTLKDRWDFDEMKERNKQLPPRPSNLKTDYKPYDVFVTVSTKGGHDD